jgi:hypothetical protein
VDSTLRRQGYTQHTSYDHQPTTNATTAPIQWIQLFDDKGEKLVPDVVAKVGDDLRKDQAVATLGRVCEALWEGRQRVLVATFICVLCTLRTQSSRPICNSVSTAAPVEWALGEAPTARCYGVSIMSADSGYLEFVPGRTFAGE